ncbi:glycosyltransferase family 1 protein, partial [Sistotremastrum suecicum HHB10207 ss-3]
MIVFVTVGSTHFDALLLSVLSTPSLQSLHQKGYTRLVMQSGNSKIEFQALVKDAAKYGLETEIYTFKPTLKEDYDRADMVISHAGSGTILDVLRLHKPMIVVPNTSLLHNHQQELASVLDSQQYLKCATVQNLAALISSFDPKILQTFPDLDAARFRSIVDEEMGF